MAQKPTRIEKRLKISMLIPAHNEEKSIARCVQSCLDQTRKLDEIIIVNDGSTDSTPDILATFGDQIKVIHTPGLGNKSYAQEEGLKSVTGDIFVTTDADTIIHPDFVKYVEEDFVRNPQIRAVGGYVRSLKHNWITACRAFEYALGQNLHKLAQHHMDYLFVIPGAAGAFHTETFKKYMAFEHDVITEDLDFTYRLHKNDFKIFYDRRAIVFTQDPATLHSYINQMRRWFGGGWQCLMKHWRLAFKQPKMALELSLMYMEGVAFSLLLFLLPFLSFKVFAGFIFMYLFIAMIFALYASFKEKRWTLLFIPFPYLLLVIINSYVFLEQMMKEVVFRQRTLTWFHPERVTMKEEPQIVS